jgi:tRNA (mo5U34)-methyltransferase
MWPDPYESLRDAGHPVLADLAWQALKNSTHGDLQYWLEAIRTLPTGDSVVDLDRAAPVLSQSVDEAGQLRSSLFTLHPWRKGPLVLGGEKIDTEWRSDWKWDRIAPHLNLEGQQVLDIGCGNGYFGLRMLGAGARLVVGIDPTMVFVMQWLAMQKLASGLNNFVLPMGIEHLPADTSGFDSVFSMGVLYHRRDPLEHLRQLKSLARPGGHVVLETLVLEGEGRKILEPRGRYARMRNVHAVPTLDVLLEWLKQSGLKAAEILDVSKTTVEEQRSTEWMTFESLQESLDAKDHTLTVEGHAAPVRAAILVGV